MRESNFSFPVQNRAAVVISSQLYDRRALDTTSPLPLFNSLTHLTYLTSTSPRIRDILTVDGGLERLVRLLREFCTHPPPPQSPREIYGLKPAVRRKSKGKGKARAGSDRVPAVIKGSTPADLAPSTSSEASSLTSFDRAAAFRFSLAFQCVVNIGVRGSETVRARVVQAGMLDVVSSVLECWLISKGFAVCPSPTGSGAPRESKEVRVARRLELLERRQRDMSTVQATELARALRNLPTYQSNARMQLERTTGPVVSLPINRRTSLPPVSAPEGNATISTNPTDEMDTSESGTSREPQSSGSASAVEEEAHDEVMETEEDESQALRRRDTIRASSLPRPISHHSAGEASVSAVGPSASSSSSSLPVPVPPSRRPNPFTQSSSGNISDSVSADTSANATPVGGNTPTGSVTIEAHARERSGTVVARPVWDNQQGGTTGSPNRQRARRTSAASRAFQPRNDHGTGTDDDNTTEAEGEQQEGHRTGPDGHPARMAVIVQADGQDGGGMDMNMIVDQGPLQGVGMGVEQGLVNLDMQANDDLAMGAPPGAPGAVQNALLPPNQQPQMAQTGQMQAVGGIGGATPRQLNDLTPRAGVAPLTTATPTATNARTLTAGGTANTAERRGGTGAGQNPPHPTPTAATPAQAITAVQLALNGLSAAGLAASGFWCSSRDAEAADTAAANNAHPGNNDAGPSDGNGASRSQHPAFAQEPRTLSREELLRLANATAQQRRTQSNDPQHDSRRREALMLVAARSPEAASVASSGIPQSASTGNVTGSPRPRIMQHAIPPVSSSNNTSSPSSMDLDGQRPSSFFRRRAGTLPGRTSPPLVTSGAPSATPDASMASPPAASTSDREALNRQETLREMVNDIISARATQGLPASTALMKVDGDIRLLIANTSLDARERDVEMRRILRDFEYALDQDREDTERARRSLPGPSSQQTPLASRRDVGGVHSSGGLDEDGDLRMGSS
ncbi:hypothetical protein FRC00_007732 [Tulasnella sp. 408]|nr:hypothetical protein FRC00_007732 [Tulasnella sp. 408]